MIQLSNLDIGDVGNLFSRKDLRDSAFQDTIMKVLCLAKSFQHLIKEKSGLSESLIWIKDPMAVIMLLEKIFLLKNLGIPEYYLGWNVEFPGDSWENQILGNK